MTGLMGDHRRSTGSAATAAWVAGILLAASASSYASPLIAYDRNANTTAATSSASPVAAPGAYTFTTLPAPSASDAAQGKTVTLAAGAGFGSPSGPLSVLTDGLVNVGQGNFNNTFVFANNTNSRIVLDLGAATNVSRVSTFGWEGDARGIQTYRLYAAAAPTDTNPSFTAATFQNDAGLLALGYTALGTANDVQTTTGQHTAAFTDTTGSLGTYRYLLFDVTNTGVGRAMAEIDVVPEPGSLALLSVVAVGLLARRRRLPDRA
jgi:hypothetical protein